MKEQLISFETAKLAKERGFDISKLEYISTCAIYGDAEYVQGFINTELYKARIDLYKDKDILLAPTQSLLQKWLREVHYMHITINYRGRYFGHAWSMKHHKYWEFHSGDFKTYEEALEQGLIESLKLIE